MNKVTWHARIVHFPNVTFGEEISHYDKYNSFCPYFRMFLWKLLVVIPITCILLGIVLGYYTEGWVSLFASHGGIPTSGFLHSHVVWVVAHVASVFMGAIVGAFFLLDQQAARKEIAARELAEANERAGITAPKPKPPGVIRMWLSMVHDKMCPVMKY